MELLDEIEKETEDVVTTSLQNELNQCYQATLTNRRVVPFLDNKRRGKLMFISSICTSVVLLRTSVQAAKSSSLLSSLISIQCFRTFSGLDLLFGVQKLFAKWKNTKFIFFLVYSARNRQFDEFNPLALNLPSWKERLCANGDNESVHDFSMEFEN